MLLYDPRGQFGQFLMNLVDVEGDSYRVALYNDSYLAVDGVRKLHRVKL